MNVSLSWLSQHLDLEGLSIAEISDMLTFAGIEVEGIQEQGVTSDTVVVAQVKEAVQHPDAEKLKVTKVDVGDGTLHQIVCGAKNYKIGDKVPCALPGSILPGNFEIKVGKLRGIDSCGMLCSATELGMVDDVDGLMILSPELAVGTRIKDIFNSDVIIEVEITPNRPDLLSHWGMAVELSAITGRALKSNPVTDTLPTEKSDNIHLDSPICPYYTATKISGVTVSDSPEWLQKKLLSIGLHPINNVVDITNFVLHELGHPLHAFDAAKVSGNLVLRAAQEDESFLALDDNTYCLLPQDLVVADSTGRALAIAGVMGGKDSGVTKNTTDIILEAAWFQPAAIRRSSRRLALSSDSSYRFERGTTYYGVLRAASLAIKLMKEICEATVSPIQQAGCSLMPPITVALPWAQLDQMTQSSIPHNEASEILTRLGLQKSIEGWVIPPWRVDLTRPVDLLEEIIRVYGLDKIPSRFQGCFLEESSIDTFYNCQMTLRQHLVGLGFYEAQTIKLIAPSSVEGTIAQAKDAITPKPILEGDLIRVALPLSEDHSVMRPSLAPGLISVAVRNARRGVKSLRFFEIGRTFRNMGGGKAKDIEMDMLGIFLAGELTPTTWSHQTPRLAAAQDLLAIIEQLLPNKEITLVPTKRAGFTQIAEVHANKKPIGIFARLNLSRCRELDLPQGSFYCALELKKILDIKQQSIKAKELALYPSSSRDAALDVPKSTTNAEISKIIDTAKQTLLIEYHCFDVFTDSTGEKLATDRKSMAYSFTYRSADRTLKSEEVDTAHKTILDHLAKNAKGLVFRV